MLMCKNLMICRSALTRSLSVSSLRMIDVPSSKPLSEERQTEITESQKKLKWRVKPFEQPNAWYTKFKVFMGEDGEPDRETLVTRLTKPIDLRPSTLKKMWKFNKEKQERYLQQFIPERHSTLGNDLAAAHFMVHRKGRVKFVGQQEWTQMDKDGNYSLPDKYVHGMFVESIDCENMEIYYEGMENLRRLKHLRFLSYKNVKNFDDWSLDRLSGSEYESLEVLDLSGTEITYRGLQALYRVPSLKKLILHDPYRSLEWKLTLAMLQDIMPNLEIVETKPALISPGNVENSGKTLNIA